MFELLIVLSAAALPLVARSLSGPLAMASGMSTAATLIWPGYLLSRLLWPRQAQATLIQRLALMPFLSVAMVVAVSLCAWLTLQQSTPEIVYAGVLIGMSAIIVGRLVQQFVPRQGAEPYPRRYRELGGALVMFAGLAALIGLAVDLPRSQVEAASFALYLDPQVTPTYDHAAGSVRVPVVIANDQLSQIHEFELSGLMMERSVVAERFAIPPGEQRLVTLAIPSTTLAPGFQWLDLRARPLGGAAKDDRLLRVWLGTNQ